MKKLIYAFTMVVVLTQIAVSQVDFWAMQGHDAQRTSRSSIPGPTAPTIKWTYDLSTRLQDNACPIVGPDGTVYQRTVGDLNYNNGFYAINPNGTLKWATKYAGTSAPGLSSDGNFIYISYVEINTQNGDTIWQYSGETRAITYSSIAVGSNSTIYFGTLTLPLNPNPTLFAFNPNGTLKWRYNSPSGCGIEAPPAIDANGNVYFVHNCIGLVALDSTGAFKWSDSRVGSGYGWPTPTIGADGTIYIDCYAFNPNGTIKWQRSDLPGVDYFAGLAISSDGSTLYTGRGNGTVYALNTSNGATVWSAVIPGATSFGGSPVLSGNGILYLVGEGGTSNGWVFAVNSFDGTLLWKYELNCYWMYWGPQSPALGPDSTLYVISSGNLGIGGGTIPARLYAFYSNELVTPLLFSPSNNSSYQSVNIKFSWKSSFNASNYRLQVSTDSSFSTTIVDDSGILGTTDSISGLGNATLYYWRVNESNASGTSKWSSVWSFSTTPIVKIIPNFINFGNVTPGLLLIKM